MYLTHFFARPESLSRARAWLDRLGFSQSQIEVRTDGAPRLSLHHLDSGHAAAARFLFNVLDSADANPAFGLFDLNAFRGWRADASPHEIEDSIAPPAFSRSVIHYELDRDSTPERTDWAELRAESRRLM